MRKPATRPPLTDAQIAARLFCGIFAAGFSWCDRAIEEHGDWQKLAFLSYDTLELTEYQPNSPLKPALRKEAEALQAKRGERYQVSTCGQYVILGGGR